MWRTLSQKFINTILFTTIECTMHVWQKSFTIKPQEPTQFVFCIFSASMTRLLYCQVFRMGDSTHDEYIALKNY